ncbi:MAG: hypothetical protein PWR30_509 [Candidatus Woesearchaeota archaeon]|nr:hypothetical protein [Candidatus Woesearchaeota archaeon]
MDNKQSEKLEEIIKDNPDLGGKVNEIIRRYDKLIDYYSEEKDVRQIENNLYNSVSYMIHHFEEINVIEGLNLVDDFLKVNEKYLNKINEEHQKNESKKSYFEFLSNISYIFSEFDKLSKEETKDDFKEMTTKTIETLIEVLNKYGEKEDMIEDLEIISSAARKGIKKFHFQESEEFCNYLKVFIRDSVLFAREKFSYDDEKKEKL